MSPGLAARPAARAAEAGRFAETAALVEAAGRRALCVRTDVPSHQDGYLESRIRGLPIPSPGDPMDLQVRGARPDPGFPAAVVFLASDAASYITGTTLTVDGGPTIS